MPNLINNDVDLSLATNVAVNNVIKENEIKISNLIGNKGIISEKEISTLGTALFVPNWNARDRP